MLENQKYRFVFTLEDTAGEDVYNRQASYVKVTDYYNPGEFIIIEPRHEKPCLCHMRTTKGQISLRIRAVWSAPLLFAA